MRFWYKVLVIFIILQIFDIATTYTGLVSERNELTIKNSYQVYTNSNLTVTYFFGRFHEGNSLVLYAIIQPYGWFALSILKAIAIFYGWAFIWVGYNLKPVTHLVVFIRDSLHINLVRLYLPFCYLYMTPIIFETGMYIGIVAINLLVITHLIWG